MKTAPVGLQHRPFLTPIYLTAAAFGLAFLFAVFLLWVLVTADATTVIVIVAPDGSTVGQARAALLSKMFGAAKGPARLDAVYIDVPGESRFTPLGAFPSYAAPQDAKKLARRVLREHSGGRVLIVSSAADQGRLVEALSGRDAPATTDGDLFIVTVPRIGHANLLRLDY
jgi:hypothetical protein